MGRFTLPVVFAVLAAFANAVPVKKDDTTDIPLTMPNVVPPEPDTYFCHGRKMEEGSENIVGFRPIGDMNVAHHILVYGCSKPGSDAPVWNCGEMAASEASSSFEKAGVCGAGSRIIYAWAMDAPSLKLPEGVGFEVGQATDVKYLVVQVHYKNVDKFKDGNVKDASGVILEVTHKKLPKPAGVFLLGTGGLLKQKSSVHMEVACMFDHQIVIHPFAFRTHAHTHGRVVSGYRVRDGKWTEIGRQDPRKPEMFYNATTANMVVKPGDILAARCTMDNEENREVGIGATQNDEMCNFYIMYYTDGEPALSKYYCFSDGPPGYYWAKDTHPWKDMLKSPPHSASVIPGTKKEIQDSTGDENEQMFPSGLEAAEEYAEQFDPRPRNLDEWDENQLDAEEFVNWLRQAQDAELLRQARDASFSTEKRNDRGVVGGW